MPTFIYFHTINWAEASLNSSDEEDSLVNGNGEDADVETHWYSDLYEGCLSCFEGSAEAQKCDAESINQQACAVSTVTGDGSESTTEGCSLLSFSVIFECFSNCFPQPIKTEDLIVAELMIDQLSDLVDATIAAPQVTDVGSIKDLAEPMIDQGSDLELLIQQVPAPQVIDIGSINGIDITLLEEEEVLPAGLRRRFSHLNYDDPLVGPLEEMSEEMFKTEYLGRIYHKVPIPRQIRQMFSFTKLRIFDATGIGKMFANHFILVLAQCKNLVDFEVKGSEGGLFTLAGLVMPKPRRHGRCEYVE